MLNVRNLQSAKLMGEVKFQAWYDRFSRQWAEPSADILKGAFWKDLHPLVKAELAGRVPDAVQKMNERYGGKWQ